MEVRLTNISAISMDDKTLPESMRWMSQYFLARGVPIVRCFMGVEPNSFQEVIHHISQAGLCKHGNVTTVFHRTTLQD